MTSIKVTTQIPTVTHLWHFWGWSAYHFVFPDFLFDKNTGHVEGAQKSVGLEPQRVALGRHQLQGVQCWIQVVAATQLNQQVHQRLTERGRKRVKKGEQRESEREGGEEGEREGGGREDRVTKTT